MTARHPALGTAQSPTATPLPRVMRPARALPSDSVRPTRAEVNLANLRHNLRVVKRAAGDAAVWCVLKADGYGHGSKAVARTLERAGADGMCVALLEEGVELRAAGIRTPILVMGGYYGRAWGELLSHDLVPVVYNADQIESIASEVRYARSEPVEVHLKVDTGMARLGVIPRDIEAVGRALQKAPEVRVSGLLTHFACADAAETASIDEQLRIFDDCTKALARLGVTPRIRHAANSAALLCHPASRLDVVRPGIALFGVEPRAGTAPELRPVMSVRSQLVAVRDLSPGQSVGYGSTWTASRDTKIATLPMGYADGLSRALSNRGNVLVRGRRAPIVGAVSMDLTMIDVTEIEGARPGDECVVLGTQKGPLGEATLSAAEIAAELGTIPWEVLTSVSRRVPRFYREP